MSLVRAVDLETVRYACAALCRLCSTMENGNLILESGAVPNLVERAIKGECVGREAEWGGQCTAWQCVIRSSEC